VQKISGLLILLSFFFTIGAYFFSENILIVAGSLVWIAFVFLYKDLTNKKMLNILLFLSMLAFVFSYIKGFSIDFIKVFTVNQYLLALLIGVGFLRLIASPKKDKSAKLPKGRQSFLKTYLGIHLFGSVINLSSLVLVADKMYKKAPLSNAQVIVLTRAFSSDAYWSPFFVAFAAAITYAPDLQTSTILINGLFLALCAFLITYFELLRNKELNLNDFRGYPIAFETLSLPFALACLVLLTNYFYPNIKVIVLIALFSFLLTLLVLPLKKGLLKAYEKLKTHSFEELPKMRLELSLFVVAGMFGISISSILLGFDFALPFEKFDWFVASILLAIFIVLAFVGVHPIITIAIIGDFLSSVNHTLLAVTFLMAWSTTVSTSPFSGLNLTIVARYSFPSKEIFKLNIKYALKMYMISVSCLFLLSNYLKL
jgi:hypothetical protein